MKKKLSILFAGMGFCAVVFLFAVQPSKAGTKGTLMGNSAGTKFCCAAGDNGCSAASCSQEML